MDVINATLGLRLNPVDFTPYTYKEIRELYKGFAGCEDELRMLMDFTQLNKADAKFLLANLKKDIERRKVS